MIVGWNPEVCGFSFCNRASARHAVIKRLFSLELNGVLLDPRCSAAVVDDADVEGALAAMPREVV